jgi:hypothetical protein
LAKDIWRDYVIRKYVRARSASEAIALSESLPVVEVNEMRDKPDVSNSDNACTHAVGFHLIIPDEN